MKQILGHDEIVHKILKFYLVVLTTLHHVRSGNIILFEFVFLVYTFCMCVCVLSTASFWARCCCTFLYFLNYSILSQKLYFLSFFLSFLVLVCCCFLVNVYSLYVYVYFMVKCAQEKFNLFHLWYDCLCFIGNSVSSMKSKRVGRCTDVLMHYTVVIVSCGQSQSQSNHKLCDRLTAKNAPSCIVKHKNPNQVRIKRGTQFYIVSAKVLFFSSSSCTFE